MSDSINSDDLPLAKRVAAELAELGEAPPSAAELDFARVGEPTAAPDVATTHTLFAIAQAPDANDLPELSQIEKRRVYNRLDLRAPPSAPAANQGVWRAVVGGVAVAAAVALVPWLGGGSNAEPTADRASRLELAKEQGAAARAAVDALGGAQDGARARALADDYASRLRDSEDAQ